MPPGRRGAQSQFNGIHATREERFGQRHYGFGIVNDQDGDYAGSMEAGEQRIRKHSRCLGPADDNRNLRTRKTPSTLGADGVIWAKSGLDRSTGGRLGLVDHGEPAAAAAPELHQGWSRGRFFR